MTNYLTILASFIRETYSHIHCLNGKQMSCVCNVCVVCGTFRLRNSCGGGFTLAVRWNHTMLDAQD
jgi:hypothetical protein